MSYSSMKDASPFEVLMLDTPSPTRSTLMVPDGENGADETPARSTAEAIQAMLFIAPI